MKNRDKLFPAVSSLCHTSSTVLWEAVAACLLETHNQMFLTDERSGERAGKYNLLCGGGQDMTNNMQSCVILLKDNISETSMIGHSY